MSQFVRQTNELGWQSDKTMRPCPCPYRCQKPTPSTHFMRFHPLRTDAEIRECPECRRQAIFPTGEGFKEDPPMASHNDSTFRKLMAAARRAGWRVKHTGAGHWALWPPDKSKQPIYVSGTPSGTRWVRAVRGKLRSCGLEV